MKLLRRISNIFNSPSRRKDIDYTKPITHEATRGVLLLLCQTSGRIDLYEWFNKVEDDFVFLHQDFAPYYRPVDPFDPTSHNPLSDFYNYFVRPSAKSVEFLDFLECAFQNDASPKDNDLIQSVNLVLNKYDCPYKLSEFIWSDMVKEGTGIVSELKNRPFIYLAQEPIVDDHAIKPVLKLFTNPEFDKPNKTFSEALRRHKDGEYRACVTSCATAVEESIKVISEKRGLVFKSGGVGKSLQSFLIQSNLPPKLKTIADFIAERRNNVSDAHANDHGDATEADARFLIGLSAAFIVYLSSKTQ